jgi:predicted negative regulator of RcsB-dependent stress response
MLAKIKQFVKENSADIILVIGVILISLLSFAAGYIAARQQEREPIKIEMYESGYCWSGDFRSLSGLETF